MVLNPYAYYNLYGDPSIIYCISCLNTPALVVSNIYEKGLCAGCLHKLIDKHWVLIQIQWDEGKGRGWFNEVQKRVGKFIDSINKTRL